MAHISQQMELQSVLALMPQLIALHEKADANANVLPAQQVLYA
jgi:hypothetical protein